MLHIARGEASILGVGSDGSQRMLRRTRAIGEDPKLGNERFGIPEPEELAGSLHNRRDKLDYRLDELTD
jgi:hypothetical protein